jgi:4-hydroxyphenylacetate 3-monooxygenase
MVARTGAQFLEGLRQTRREIWVEGERVADVTTNPKLRGGAEASPQYSTANTPTRRSAFFPTRRAANSPMSAT